MSPIAARPLIQSRGKKRSRENNHEEVPYPARGYIVDANTTFYIPADNPAIRAARNMMGALNDGRATKRHRSQVPAQPSCPHIRKALRSLTLIDIPQTVEIDQENMAPPATPTPTLTVAADDDTSVSSSVTILPDASAREPEFVFIRSGISSDSEIIFEARYATKLWVKYHDVAPSSRPIVDAFVGGLRRAQWEHFIGMRQRHDLVVQRSTDAFSRRIHVDKVFDVGIWRRRLMFRVQARVKMNADDVHRLGLVREAAEVAPLFAGTALCTHRPSSRVEDRGVLRCGWETFEDSYVARSG